MAYQIYEEAGPRRSELEARILAAEPAPEIARKMAIDPETVETFAAWFFDVADRLGATAHVMHVAIALPPGKPLPITEYHRLWLLYGYFRGSQVLDVMVAAFRDPGPELALVGPEGRRSIQDLRLRLLCRLSVAIHLLPVGNPLKTLNQLAAYERIGLAVQQAGLGSLAGAGSEQPTDEDELRRLIDDFNPAEVQPTLEQVIVMERTIKRLQATRGVAA
jgi:hypothetical protein